MMLFPVHKGLGIAPNVGQSVVKVHPLPLIPHHLDGFERTIRTIKMCVEATVLPFNNENFRLERDYAVEPSGDCELNESD